MSSAARYVDWIRSGLLLPGKTKGGLAAVLGVHQSQVTRIINQERAVKAEEVPLIEDYLGVEAPGRDAGNVPLVGFVGAGAEAHFYNDAQGPFDQVDAPPRRSEHTVAVQVRGDSMPGAAEDGWLLYYDDIRHPIDDTMVGRKSPVVVGLDNGKVLVKRVRPGTRPGHYHLLSTGNDDPIIDARVVWAARITWIKPNWNV